MKVEVLYFEGCPHVEPLVVQVESLLVEHAIREPLRTIAISDQNEAVSFRFLGSPTLRIDDVDVDPTASTRSDYGMQCRLYPSAGGLSGSPPDEWIIKALKGNAGP